MQLQKDHLGMQLHGLCCSWVSCMLLLLLLLLLAGCPGDAAAGPREQVEPN
jgi:hypothetical protein